MRDPHKIREKLELQLDNRQIVSFVIGALVVLGVVFALGVLVGKQLAVSAMPAPKAADPLAEVDARQSALAGPADAGAPPAAAAANEPLTFAAELTKPKPANAAIEPTRPAGEKVAAVKPAESKPEPKPAEPPPDEKSATLANAFDKAAAKTEPKPAATGAWCVQVASLPSRAEADKVAAKLKAKGHTPYVADAKVGGKRVYRVRMGPFESRGAADDFLKGFRVEGLRPAVMPNK